MTAEVLQSSKISKVKQNFLDLMDILFAGISLRPILHHALHKGKSAQHLITHSLSENIPLIN